MTSIRGYVPSVYDMFHVGHLNVIRAARPYCDHLIVGVVTDEVVEAVKGKPPIVPLRERMEIVGALRDVDEGIVPSSMISTSELPSSTRTSAARSCGSFLMAGEEEVEARADALRLLEAMALGVRVDAGGEVRAVGDAEEGPA